MGRHKGYNSGQKSTNTYFTQGQGAPHAGTGKQSGVSGAIAAGLKLVFRGSDGKKQK